MNCQAHASARAPLNSTVRPRLNEMRKALLAATIATLAVSALVWAVLQTALGFWVYLVLTLPLRWIADIGIYVGGQREGFLDINVLGYLLWVGLLWVISFMWALLLKNRQGRKH
jgi:hypothetical protein